MLRSRTTIARAIGYIAVTLVLALQGVRTEQAPDAARSDLTTLFAPGGVLLDKNGDGVVDAVNARIVLGSSPSASDVSAGADIAARLGFETSAMDLPMPSAPGQFSIAIGAAGASAAGIQANVPQLAPGEGVAQIVDGGTGGLVVAGGDDAGTRAAAEWVAGRLPHAWDPNGPTLDAIAGDVRTFLTGSSIGVSSVRVPSVRVRAGADGLDRIDVAVKLTSTADAAKAATALRGLTAPPAAAKGRSAAAPSSAPANANEKRALSYAGVHSVHVSFDGAGAADKPVDVAGATPVKPGPIPARPGSGAKESLTLANLYANDGLLGDGDNNQIPDRLDVLLSPAGPGTEGTVDLAARLGLESAGIVVPVAIPGDQIASGNAQPTLVLIGTAHPLVDELVKQGKFTRPALQAGEGLIQVVPKAFGEKPAIVVTGADAKGVSRALNEMAVRMPNLWERGKDRTTIGDTQEDVRRFLAGRTPAGQAAMALYKLGLLGDQLKGKDLESAQILVSLEKPADGLPDFVRREAGSAIKADRIDVTVENRDVQHAKTIFKDDFDIPSEVDEFWEKVRTKIVPAVRKGQPVVIEARLSEPPELRADLEKRVRDELLKGGADAAQTKVTVLSAYKQGYSWLYDVVRPALAGKNVDRITIRYAKLGPPPDWKQASMFVPTRWLQELYPIDETLSRDLKISPDHVVFEQAPEGSPAYEVTATAGGQQAFHGTFDPKFVERPFFDQFPSYERVRVTTGWINASVRGQQVLDERIETDLERFWDHFQAKTLPAIYTHEMTVSKGKPRPDDAPFFGELRFDVTLSEPSYKLGVDNEQIASLESLQEELYFNTLQFFDVLGREARGPQLEYVGRVIPVVHPKSDGKPGHASISFTGFSTNRPAVVIEYKERGGAARQARLDIPKIATEPPLPLAARVRDGQNGITQLDFRLKVDTPDDQRATLVKRVSAEQADERILSAAQVRAVLQNLGRLRGAGLYRDALAYHDLGSLRVLTGVSFEPAKTDAVLALDANGSPAPWPDIKKLLPAGFKYDGKTPLVQWDTPIPPPEGAEILAKMSTFPQATVYRVVQTYLGKDSWVMELQQPIASSHISMAKMTTLKPTIVYSARQDANEVSSTSHTLKLAEMLLTDPQYKDALKRVNVVFHPFTNPDGAQLAYDLYKVTPDYMLHPGYLGSLGVSLVSSWAADPMYPESAVRPKLWKTYLPDIFLNPHGYPSHEWVQVFSEYVPWIRNRVSEARGWWGMRGWFIPGFNYLDDPRYPRNKEAVFHIRDLITRNMNAVPQVKAFNQRAMARYDRYTSLADDETFKNDVYNGVTIFTSIKGSRSGGAGGRGGGGGGDDFMTRQPNITIFYGSTEAPDETAYGDWMKLVATMGLQWDKAMLESILEGKHTVDRKASAFFGGTTLSLDRPRPPKEQQPRATTSNQQ